MPAADAAMKQGKWEKKRFLGEEIRHKTLGLAGLGRIGQEVARRASAFGMQIIAHDPFISEQVAADQSIELVTLDDLFARADYLSLHMPSNEKTRHIVNADRLAKARKGIRIVNTARGDLIDEAALADAIESGQVAGAALDVFHKEPPPDPRLQNLAQVVATPHIAASTREGQELVGVETAAALRDFLRDGIIRNAVNFPSLSAEEFGRLRPFVELGERLGAFLSQLNDDRPHTLSVPLLRRTRRGAERRDRERRTCWRVHAHSVVRCDTRERPQRRRRPRYRDRRVAQYQNAELHESPLGQVAIPARASTGWRARSSSLPARDSCKSPASAWRLPLTGR